MNLHPLASMLVTTLGAVLACGAVLGCGGGERPPHFEDMARTTVPLPECVISLPIRPNASGARNLSEEEVWHLLFPRYDMAKHELPLDAEACTGQRIFDDPIFAGATMPGAATAVKEGDVVFGNAGDRVRIVWLRTRRWSDGSEAGPLALVRATESSAEVYAIGVHRRVPSKTTFQGERVGPDLLVSAADDGCEDKKMSTCINTVTLYLPNSGRLDRLKTFTVEQHAFGSGTETGVIGQLDYQLTSSPEYGSTGVKLFEEIETKDSGGHVLHKTELERNFVLKNGTLEGGPESLWGRVQSQMAATVPPPSTHSKTQGDKYR